MMNHEKNVNYIEQGIGDVMIEAGALELEFWVPEEDQNYLQIIFEYELYDYEHDEQHIQYMFTLFDSESDAKSTYVCQTHATKLKSSLPKIDSKAFSYSGKATGVENDATGPEVYITDYEEYSKGQWNNGLEGNFVADVYKDSFTDFDESDSENDDEEWDEWDDYDDEIETIFDCDGHRPLAAIHDEDFSIEGDKVYNYMFTIGIFDKDFGEIDTERKFGKVRFPSLLTYEKANEQGPYHGYRNGFRHLDPPKEDPN